MADWKSRKGIKATMAAEKTTRSLVRCMQRPKTMATSGRGLKNGRNASGPRATVTGARKKARVRDFGQIRPAWDTQDTNEEEGTSGGREDIDDPGPTCSALGQSIGRVDSSPAQMVPEQHHLHSWGGDITPARQGTATAKTNHAGARAGVRRTNATSNTGTRAVQLAPRSVPAGGKHRGEGSIPAGNFLSIIYNQ